MYTYAFPAKPFSRFRIEETARFLSPEYYAERHRYHKGIDINIKTGGDSDLGYPLQSMFPGTVLEVGIFPGWGGICLVRADEWVRREFQTLLALELPVLEVAYCHFLQCCVEPGEHLDAGDPIGSIGKGDLSQYLAHLHLELRRTSLPANDPQGGDQAAHQHVLTHYLDPFKVLMTAHFDDRPNILPARQLVAPPVRGVSINSGALKPAAGRQVLVNVVSDKLYLRIADESR